MVAYTQLFHNGQPDRNETATINKQIKHHNTYTFTVERGIDTGLSGTWSAGIQDVVGATTEISAKFSTLCGNTETTITETTYSLSQVVNVPPETTVQVLLIISDEIVVSAWSANFLLVRERPASRLGTNLCHNLFVETTNQWNALFEGLYYFRKSPQFLGWTDYCRQFVKVYNS